jgi:hypothetical protein
MPDFHLSALAYYARRLHCERRGVTLVAKGAAEETNTISKAEHSHSRAHHGFVLALGRSGVRVSEDLYVQIPLAE